jgi:uncharacterized membrane protein YjjP (DUF1212 family)
MADLPDIDQDSKVDEETAEDIQEDLAESDEDVSRVMRLSAGVQLVVLFVAIAAALVLAVLSGLITPSIAISATVNIGWVVEYLIIALAAAFIIYVFALLIIVLPGSVLDFLGGLAYGAAVAAGLVETENNNSGEG